MREATPKKGYVRRRLAGHSNMTPMTAADRCGVPPRDPLEF